MASGALYVARATKRPTDSPIARREALGREENVCRHKETYGTYISNVTARQTSLETLVFISKREKDRAARKGGKKGENIFHYIRGRGNRGWLLPSPVPIDG